MLIVAMLMGCGPSRDSFVERYVDASCDLSAQCGPQTVEECRAAFAETEWAEAEDYDSAVAADCLDAVEGADRDGDCSVDAAVAISQACEGL